MNAPQVWYEPLEKGVWMVGAGGRLDHSAVPLLESALNQLLAAGHAHIVIDLGQATYMNSGVLRILVSTWRAAKSQQGDVHICGMNQRLAEIFEMVGFQQVFQTHPTLDDALQAITGSLNE